MDLLIRLLIPLLMGLLKTMESGHQIRTMNHVEQGVELRFDLPICVMQRLKEDRVARQKETAQAGLFIDHQFDQAIAVKNDDVGAIDRSHTLLNTFQPVAEDERQNTEACCWQG